jgi:Sap, sulfolipid-1-addressing protein
MGEVVLLSLVSAFNPTLIAVTTVMLLLPEPGRLMLGYWLGAMVTSITLGLLIVFSLHGSSTVRTTKKTLSPLADIVLGGLTLVLALALARHGNKRVTERRAQQTKEKKPPRWQRALQTGTAKTTFVIGAMLTLPGASYLAGLNRLSKLHYSKLGTVLAVLGFNLVMLTRGARPDIRRPGSSGHRRGARTQGDHRAADMSRQRAVSAEPLRTRCGSRRGSRGQNCERC